MIKKVFLNNSLRVVVYIIFLLSVIFYPIFFKILGFEIKHRIVEEYNFQVNEPSKIKLAVILPSDGAYQEINDIKIEWKDDVEMINYGEVKVARITGELKNNSFIRIKYISKMKTGRINWDEKVLPHYIQDEIGIESTEDLIVNKANSITKGTSLSDVEKIYNFVSEHVKWRTEERVIYGENIQSALTALQTSEGVCGEFANLMVALCRAKEIPAKSISGLALPYFSIFSEFKKSNWSHQAGAHAWVEFYSDGQWHFADPSWGSSINFNNIDGLHLSYGQSGHFKKVYDENFDWAEKDYYIIGAMSSPLKFAASASSKSVTVTPVGFLDNSTKYIFLTALILTIIVIEYIVKRTKTKAKDNTTFNKE